jgi:hypothetical protein
MEKDYLLELEELREILGWLLRKDFLEELVTLRELLNRSYVNRYKELMEQSEHGSNCGYAAKAKDMFMKFKERDIAAKIKSLYETYIKSR